MKTLYFITHPEIVPDPSIPISMWDYSEHGIARWQGILKKIWIKDIEIVFTSPEERAKKAAQQLVDALGYTLHILHDLGPINRISTGILQNDDFSACAITFWEKPNESCRGWETAADAQKRAVRAVETILKETDGYHHIAAVSHEDIVNLIICHYQGIPIEQHEEKTMGFSLHFDDKGSYIRCDDLAV